MKNNGTEEVDGVNPEIRFPNLGMDGVYIDRMSYPVGKVKAGNQEGRNRLSL